MNSPQSTQPDFLDRDVAAASREYRRTALTGFLRTRRARIDPDPRWPVVDPCTPRRVAGMRREELAWAAGMSVDYYTKLEQGRANHPSPMVVEALCAALQLPDLDRRYLQALTSPTPVPAPVNHPESLTAAAATLQTLGNQLREPVMLHLLTYDLIIRQLEPATERVLYPDGRAAAEPGSVPGSDLSLLTYIFTEPVSRRVYIDWSEKAREVTGLAHLSLATTIPTERFLHTLAHLWATSSAFRYLWSRYEPHEKANGSWRLRLPSEGIVRCAYSTFQTPNCPDLSLVVYRREETAEAAGGPGRPGPDR